MQPHFEFSQSARRGMSSRPVARAIRSHETREEAPQSEPSDQCLEAAQALSVFSTKLKQVLGAERWTSWGKDLRVGDADEDMVRVFAPTAVHRERLMNSIGARKLREMWMDVDPLGRTLDLRAASETSARAVRRPSSAARAVSGSASAPAAGAQRMRGLGEKPGQGEDAAVGRPAPHVGDQPPATFDNFVEGAANKYAYASARTIAYDEEPPYKVLVITGAYGGGKSHLLSAVAHAFEERGEGDQLLACNADDFRADFVKSLREKTGVDFKTRVKKARVLVIDDIHRLESSKKTQEELSNIVCSVVDAGGRVIIAADRPVSKLDVLDPQLASRLSGAVNCQIEQPDLDHRRRILQKMAALNPMAKRGVEIPEAVLDYIASAIVAMPRDLQAALNTVISRTALVGVAVNLENAREALADTINGAVKRVTVEEIQKTVARYHGMPVSVLLSKRRTRDIVRPRQEAMFLCKEFTTRSLPDIGKRFGDMDHTTVMHACKRISSLMDENANVRSDIEQLRRMLRQNRERPAAALGG